MRSFLLVMVSAAGVVTVIYSVTMLLFQRGLTRLKQNRRADPANWPTVSVIMPARNEASVLPWTLESLMKQDYPGLWEVIVVDDRSEDATAQTLETLQSRYANLRAVRVTELPIGSPKKRALAAGIASSEAEIVFTTDADCQYHRSWLREMVRHLSENVGVVAGLTVFDLPDSARAPRWQKLQWLDFFVQNFLAAGALGWGHAASCNGSNLCYRRVVYDEISGYGEGEAVVSGDDVLFAQRVAKETKWKMVFATTPETLVRSLPVPSLRELFHQRLRWASKGLSYRGSMLVFLFAVYAYYLMLAMLPIAALLAPEVRVATTLTWGTKLLVDAALIWTACRIFAREWLFKFFLEYEVWHTLATPLIGIAGLFVPYRWKGDWYRTASLPPGTRTGTVRAKQATEQDRRHMNPQSVEP